MSLTKVTNSMISGAYANVLDFGAKGDGITNDTDAIKAAMVSGAGCVYFPSGTYMCDQILWGDTTPGIGAIRLIGEVAALAGSFQESTAKTTRIKARSANAVFWRFNYSHNLVVENIAFDGGGFSDIVVQLQQGCFKHEWSNCTFEGATASTGTVVYLGDPIINLQVDFNVFRNCIFATGYDTVTANFAAQAVNIVKTNTIENKFYNCFFSKTKTSARLQGSSQTDFYGCHFVEFDDQAIQVVGVSHFNMKLCYSESTIGTKFLSLVDVLYSESVQPIVIEDNSINQTVGNSFDATPNVPMVFRNNRLGQEVFVNNPTTSTLYHPVILENNQFLTGGITGSGATKYCQRKANTLNGVYLFDTDGYWQEYFNLSFAAPGAVPGSSTVSITVPGAVVGDEIGLAFGTAIPSNFVMQAQPTAANTVTVVATQISGAAATLTTSAMVLLYKRV